MQAPRQTAEIELADLDLDLSGLDDIDDDELGEDSDIVEAETGLDDGETMDLDAPGDDTQQQPALSLDEDVVDIGELADDVESTAEMRNLDDSEIGDTAEQPFCPWRRYG